MGKALDWITGKSWQADRSVLPNGRLVRGITLLAGGAALGQVISFLASPVLTRLYSPNDFGIFGVFISLLGLVAVIASLSYEYAIPIPEDDETAADILGLCFLVLLIMNLLLWATVYAFGDQISTWFNAPESKYYLWLLPFGMFAAGTYRILNYWAIREKNYKIIGKTQLIRAITAASIKICMACLVSGPIGLLSGQLGAEIAGISSLWTAAWEKDNAFFRAINLQRIQKAAKKFKDFPIYVGLSSVIDALGTNVPQILFAIFYGPEIVGWFVLAQQIIGAPMNIIVSSVDQVYFGEIAQLSRNNPHAIKRLFIKMTKKLALLEGLPVLLIFFSAPWIFKTVFGLDWEMAGRYAQFLVLMFSVRFTVIPLQNTLYTIFRQNLFVPWTSIKLIMAAGSILLGHVMGFPVNTIIAGYSLSMSLAYIILWVIIWRELNKACNYEDRKENRLKF